MSSGKVEKPMPDLDTDVSPRETVKTYAIYDKYDRKTKRYTVWVVGNGYPDHLVFSAYDIDAALEKLHFALAEVHRERRERKRHYIKGRGEDR